MVHERLDTPRQRRDATAQPAHKSIRGASHVRVVALSGVRTDLAAAEKAARAARAAAKAKAGAKASPSAAVALPPAARRAPHPLEADAANVAALERLRALRPDDAAERRWLASLRPDKNLCEPAEAFAQGVKQLRPALRFHTFDAAKARARRREVQETQRAVFAARRAAQVAPTVAMKSALDPHKVMPDRGAAARARAKARGAKGRTAGARRAKAPKEKSVPGKRIGRTL